MDAEKARSSASQVYPPGTPHYGIVRRVHRVSMTAGDVCGFDDLFCGTPRRRSMCSPVSLVSYRRDFLRRP